MRDWLYTLPKAKPVIPKKQHTAPKIGHTLEVEFILFQAENDKILLNLTNNV